MAASSALLLGKADEINTSLTKISRKADKKRKAHEMAVSSALLSGKADEIKTSLTKIRRKADEKKKGPRNDSFVGLSSCMAHEMTVSSAFLHYGRRNLNFVPRVFFISSVNVLFLVVRLVIVALKLAEPDFDPKSKLHVN